MNYAVGSPIRVRLYSGQIVDANITAIVSRSAGRKIYICLRAYGNVNITVYPEQTNEAGLHRPRFRQTRCAPRNATRQETCSMARQPLDIDEP
jgi:hypothetical protein